MRIGLVCALLAGMALAGCAENETTEVQDAVGEDESDATGAVNETLAAFVLNATVDNLTVSLGEPFVIRLDSDLAEGATNATWSARLVAINATTNGTDVLADASGVGLPAAFNLTSQQAGNLTLNFTAAAPGYANASAARAVAVADAVAAAPLPDPVTITGSALIGHPANSAICVQDGIDGDKHAVAPAEKGWKYRLNSGFAVYWWNGSSYVSAGGGTVNASHAEICATGATGGSYTLTMWHPDAPEPA